MDDSAQRSEGELLTATVNNMMRSLPLIHGSPVIVGVQLSLIAVLVLVGDGHERGFLGFRGSLPQLSHLQATTCASIPPQPELRPILWGTSGCVQQSEWHHLLRAW